MLDDENDVSMMVIFFFFLVADDRLCFRALDCLCTDGMSLRRRGSSCGTSLLTGVRDRALDRTAGLGEVGGEGELDLGLLSCSDM